MAVKELAGASFLVGDVVQRPAFAPPSSQVTSSLLTSCGRMASRSFGDQVNREALLMGVFLMRHGNIESLV